MLAYGKVRSLQTANRSATTVLRWCAGKHTPRMPRRTVGTSVSLQTRHSLFSTSTPGLPRRCAPRTPRFPPTPRSAAKTASPSGAGWRHSQRRPACPIVDVLTDTEHWLHWTTACGPLSGCESRLLAPRPRYVPTTCCYGGSLGPTHTSRSLPGIDRRQGASVNQYHITEQKLLDATVGVINRFNRFMLPKSWGSGQRAAADGTTWDIYEHKLRSA
jgi:hypothetical protein